MRQTITPEKIMIKQGSNLPKLDLGLKVGEIWHDEINMFTQRSPKLDTPLFKPVREIIEEKQIDELVNMVLANIDPNGVPLEVEWQGAKYCFRIVGDTLEWAEMK